MTRPSPVRRGVAAAVLVPLALLSFTACGGDDEQATDASSTTSASPSADPSESASSDSSSDTLEKGASISPSDFVAKLANGAENSTTAHITTTTSGGAADISGSGDVDYTSDPPSVAMTMKSGMLGNGDIDVRLVDGIIYMSIPSLTQGKFLKVDLSDPNNPLGSAFSSQLDPIASLKALGTAATSITYEGDEDVSGESLGHYAATVDTQKLFTAMGQEDLTKAPNLPDSIDYDIWLDDQDRLGQMKADMGSLGKTEFTVTDWGTDVDIQAPPASDVTTMPQLNSGAA